MFKQILNDLNLSKKEQIIFELILEFKRISAGHLARMSKINRTTVYSVAKELKQKGLIIEDLGGKTIFYSPESVYNLLKIIEKDKKDLIQKERTLKNLVSIIETMPKTNEVKMPKIKLIEEKDLEEFLDKAVEKWNKSMLETDKTWWGFQDASILDKFKNDLDKYWAKLDKKITVKIFTNNTDEERNIKNKSFSNQRQVKFLNNQNFTASQQVVGNYILFWMTRQRPMYIIEIEDKEMANNLRELFKTFWEKV
jgi:sugar-specific transcriptional regulator TrmB